MANLVYKCLDCTKTFTLKCKYTEAGKLVYCPLCKGYTILYPDIPIENVKEIRNEV